MNTKINICIVHYNTPLLTECLIKSINKFTPNSKIYIFDNSDKLPFTYRQDNLVYFDNTGGQYINFQKWLKNFRNKITFGSPSINNYASAKHTISIEKCIELIDENFILLDSDILLKCDISELYDSKYLWVGGIESDRLHEPRVVPYLLFINVDEYKKKRYRFFNEKYMHGLSLEGHKYDTCAYFYMITRNDNVKIINFNKYIVHYKAGSWELEAKTHNNYMQVPANIWLNNNRKYWKDLKTDNKVVVYTAITGNYDIIIPQTYVDDNFDYVCFTDDPCLESGLYEIRLIPNELLYLPKVKQQRYIKVNASKYLSNYDISIWLDANVELLGNPLDFIDSENCIYIPEHPKRKCIYDEGNECINSKRDNPEIIKKQLSSYKDEGYPVKNGLVQSNIIIRKHNEQECINLMNTWWNEIEYKSCRDQLSFNYAWWKNKDVHLKLLNKYIYKNLSYFYWHKGHGKIVLNLVKKRMYKELKLSLPSIQNNEITKLDDSAPKMTTTIKIINKPTVVKTLEPYKLPIKSLNNRAF